VTGDLSDYDQNPYEMINKNPCSMICFDLMLLLGQALGLNGNKFLKVVIVHCLLCDKAAQRQQNTLTV